MHIDELNQQEISLVAGCGGGAKFGAYVGLFVGTVKILHDFAAQATIATVPNRADIMRIGESVVINGAGVFGILKYSGIVSLAMVGGTVIGTACEKLVKDFFDNDNT